MSFAQAVRAGCSNGITFRGRASRSEYWWYAISTMIFLDIFFNNVCNTQLGGTADFGLQAQMKVYAAGATPVNQECSVSYRSATGKSAQLGFTNEVGELDFDVSAWDELWRNDGRLDKNGKTTCGTDGVDDGSQLISRYGDSYFCEVTAIQVIDSLASVSIHVWGDGQLGPLQDPTESTLQTMQGKTFAVSSSSMSKQTDKEIVGVLSFYVGPDQSGPFQFSFGSSGFSLADLSCLPAPDEAADGLGPTTSIVVQCDGFIKKSEPLITLLVQIKKQTQPIWYRKIVKITVFSRGPQSILNAAPTTIRRFDREWWSRNIDGNVVLVLCRHFTAMAVELGTLCGGLASLVTATVRRLHDSGRSGWRVLLIVVPGVNFLVLFWLIVGSEPRRNAFGSVPTNCYPPLCRLPPSFSRTGLVRRTEEPLAVAAHDQVAVD
jgi:uncharacterized membrane protein YhaH (DUF805 family)